MAVYKRGKTWTAQVSWYDEHGKRHFKTKSGFKTKSTANKWLHETEAAKDKQQLSTKHYIFADYFYDWYTTYRTVSVSHTTQVRYDTVHKYLKSFFGKTRLENVTRHKYQEFMNEYGSEHAKNTVYKTAGTIRACAADALADGLIQKDFTKVNLTWNDNKTRKIDYLNYEELQKLKVAIISKLTPRYTSRYMLLTILYTGMRPGEISVLKWDDLDFENNTISITKSFNHNIKRSEIKDWDSEEIEGPTKNTPSVRVIKVDKYLLDTLKELKVNGHKHLFVNFTGTIPSSTDVNKVIRKLLKECKIDKQSFHFHSLRHSHVAMLLFKGVELYAISRRLGHADMATTAKKYAYMLDELQQKEDIKIEKILDDL